MIGGSVNGGVAGTEGTGVVEAVGSQVKGLKSGDRVVTMGLGSGAWATRAVVPAGSVFVLQGGKKLSAEQACSLLPVCAALQMVTTFSHGLKQGDVVLHAGSPGAVGMAVAQIASSKGFKVVSIIRDEPGSADAVALLKEHGSYLAVTADYARTAAFRKLVSDLPAPRLLLNGLGGRAAVDAGRLLVAGSSVVTYAGSAMQIPASLFIDRGVRFEGFNLQRTLKSAGRDVMQNLVSEAEKLVVDGKVKLMLERFPLSKFQAALLRHLEPARQRKIVLDHTK